LHETQTFSLAPTYRYAKLRHRWVTPNLCATDDVINKTDVDGTRVESNSFVGDRLLVEQRAEGIPTWQDGNANKQTRIKELWFVRKN